MREARMNPFDAPCPVCGRPGSLGVPCAWCGEDIPDRGRFARGVAYALLMFVCAVLDFLSGEAISKPLQVLGSYDALVGMAIATLAVPFFLPKTRLGEIFNPRVLGWLLLLFAVVRFGATLFTGLADAYGHATYPAPILSENAVRSCLVVAALWLIADVPQLPPIPQRRTMLGRLYEAYSRPLLTIVLTIVAIIFPTPIFWLPAALATHRIRYVALALILLALC